MTRKVKDKVHIDFTEPEIELLTTALRHYVNSVERYARDTLDERKRRKCEHQRQKALAVLHHVRMGAATRFA